MSTITLTGNYGYTPYKITGLAAGTTIDAETASWIHDNNNDDGNSNPYPFMVYKSPGAILDGGKILGEIDQTSEWRTVYNMGNSAGIRTEDSPNVVIRDWHITDTWDAIRVSWNSPNFLIEDVWVENARDDAVENDRLLSGTIRDSLFDGVFAGLSIDPSSSSPVDGHDETVTLDSVLLRLQPSLYNGEMTHASFIKTDSAADGAVTPNLRFVNSVFAIEDVEHRSYRSMFDAWANTIESSGNVFLNLSDTPLPDDYPKPPAGWTILEGQEARDYWQQARAEWINRHAGDGEEPVPDVGEEPVPDVGEEPVPDVGEEPVPDVGEEPVPDVGEEPVPDVGEEPVPDVGEEPIPGVGEEPVPDVDEEPVPDVGSATFEGVMFEGNDDDEIIVGNALDNNIDGNNGDDTIRGGTGNDIIRGDDGVDVYWGDAGNDVFFFKRTSDSRESRGVDTIMDFNKGDKIDISNIDANRNLSGDQAFELITGELTKTPGQLTFEFDASSGNTVVTGNIDTDLDAEFMLLLNGDIALADSDFVLEEPVPDVGEEPIPDVGEEPVPDVDEEPVPDVGSATFEGVMFEGNDDDEIIVGNALDNNIDGNNGDDTIRGGTGNDIIRGDDGVDVYWGDAGNDVFFFKRTSDSRESRGVDTIMDFNKGDKIDISNIDANRNLSGDQAFELITGELTETPGQLTFEFDASSGNTVVTGNIDTDLDAEFMLLLKGDIALADSDFVL